MYKLTKKSQKGMFYACIVSIFLNVALNVFGFPFFWEYNKLLTRLPAYFLGCYIAPSVYKNEKISAHFLFLLWTSLFFIGPFYYATEGIQESLRIVSILYRLKGLWVSFSVMFLVLVLADYFQNTSTYKRLSKIGNYTLEIYITHIAVRDVLLYKLHLDISSRSGIIFFISLLILFTILLSLTLEKIVKKIDKPLSQYLYTKFQI